MGRILAIDYGQKRTGLAVTDPLRITANPLITIETKDLIQWLTDYLHPNQVDLVIIGHPTRLDGTDSDSMKYITPFMNRFRRLFPDTPLVPFDERFTSTLAHRAMIDGGMKKKQRQDKAVVDKIAATILLEDYLNYKQ